MREKYTLTRSRVSPGVVAEDGWRVPHCIASFSALSLCHYTEALLDVFYLVLSRSHISTQIEDISVSMKVYLNDLLRKMYGSHVVVSRSYFNNVGKILLLT